MKKIKILPLTAALLFLLSALACHRDVESPTTVKPPGNLPVSFRSPCTDPDLCNCSITSDADAMLAICGDVPIVFTSCSTGCSGGNTGFSGEFPELEEREFCVDQSANLCITSLSTTTSVGVRVEFGSSTPLFETLSPLETHCFHTNNDCDVTNDGCQ